MFGESGTGKTLLAMQALLFASRAGSGSFFLDTEGAFRPERLESMALARGWDPDALLKRIEYARAKSLGEQVEAVRRMEERKETKSCRLVAIDTLTKNFSVELPGEANLSSRQGALDAHLSEIARDAVLNRRAYVLTNRVTFGPTHDVGIGGATVEQLVGRSMRLDRSKDGVMATSTESEEQERLTIGGSGVE